jgi:Uma2 family endonuclease
MEPLGTAEVRPVPPVDFPSTDEEWDMPEGLRHRNLCGLLYHLLRRCVGDLGAVGSDQFVYFDASNPKRKCAPDAFVKLGATQTSFPSWKTWDKGVPELCVEILSPSETEEKLPLGEKLARFLAMGVAEVVAYDVEGEPGARLRAWDLVDGALVERVVEGEATPCRTLDLWFVIAPWSQEREPHALRLAHDARGGTLVTTAEEGALARVAELEQLLAAK